MEELENVIKALEESVGPNSVIAKLRSDLAEAQAELAKAQAFIGRIQAVTNTLGVQSEGV